MDAEIARLRGEIVSKDSELASKDERMQQLIPAFGEYEKIKSTDVFKDDRIRCLCPGGEQFPNNGNVNKRKLCVLMKEMMIHCMNEPEKNDVLKAFEWLKNSHMRGMKIRELLEIAPLCNFFSRNQLTKMEILFKQHGYLDK